MYGRLFYDLLREQVVKGESEFYRFIIVTWNFLINVFLCNK